MMTLVLMTISYFGGLHMRTPRQLPKEYPVLVIETEVEEEPEVPEGVWLLHALDELEELRAKVTALEDADAKENDLAGRVKLLERREEEMVSRLRTVVAAAQHSLEKPRYRDLVLDREEDYNDFLGPEPYYSRTPKADS